MYKSALLIEITTDYVSPCDSQEIRGLAKTAGYEIFGEIQQHIRSFHPRFFLGKGKMDEIRHLIESWFETKHHYQKDMPDDLYDLGIETGLIPPEVNQDPKEEYPESYTKILFPDKLQTQSQLNIIFNNRLAPMQILALSKLWGCKVIDRDELILQIFEQNARTTEAKLQIELARSALEANLVKSEVGKHLSEKQGRDFKGTGRMAWEPRMRAYRQKRKTITRNLEDISKGRQLRRKKRIKFFNVGIIGYTNAGKSTLLNSLSKSTVETANQEFTTVSTTSRKVTFPKFDNHGNWQGEEVILTDSVGFVQDMSPVLIDAFLSTLEELQFSNLILIVVDISEVSERQMFMKLHTSLEVMEQIGASDIPKVFVMNKIDACEPEILASRLAHVKTKFQLNPIVPISALNRQDFEFLAETILGFKRRDPRWNKAVSPYM